jgi:hypothetical protein
MREWGAWIRVIGAVIAIAGGCADASPETMARPAAQQVMKPPADRADCLKPPWTPAGSSSGIHVSQCENERVYRFVLGDGAPVSDDVQTTFLNAHRDELEAADGIVSSAWGLCCVEDKVAPDQSCVVFDLRLCSTSLPKFIDMVRELQAADSNVAKHSLRVSVALDGPTEPRCKASDVDCGPLPYSGKGAQTAPKTRTPVDPVDPKSETCSQDGECVANGCGNECDYWTLGDLAGTCPYFTKLEGAFCGCVEDHCAWFH